MKMNYDFDKVIDRRNTNCLKYDFTETFHKPEDILPLWVADMDFESPKEVREALIRAAEHGIYGYTGAKDDYYEAVADWFSEGFGWRPEKRWMVKAPGVVFAVSTAVRGLTEPGDAVLIQTPVYYPFAASIADNGRKVIRNSLCFNDGRYTIDFEDFEEKIRENHVKLFILCSPHNPVGRVWSREELTRMGDICEQYGVIIASDEIHCDFTYAGHTHTVYASLGEKYANHSIICTAPSKTFNLAGLQASNIFIPNQEIRRRYIQAANRTGYKDLNMMGTFAAQAAYRYGRPWLNELKEYLAKNLELVRTFVREELPGVHLVEPEGTYLVWLDCRELGYSDKELNDKLVSEAKLWLDGGSMFGEEGENFQRVNIACPKSVLQEALHRFKKVL
jgi:cystathionine beta-lyase